MDIPQKEKINCNNLQSDIDSHCYRSGECELIEGIEKRNTDHRVVEVGEASLDLEPGRPGADDPLSGLDGHGDDPGVKLVLHVEASVQNRAIAISESVERERTEEERISSLE
ncbi:hypothetical protein CDAR_266211 [Caerostris darwini]|uniref:Uncharacterized protein n=1 Tax=Caerostris darwini TaxID=1538125 RepID=A0AAV4QZJ2_9ARAC|nr:hypothetical protein CDAR_266211 [Caerostris darwini]